jgi:hypothetical protein
MIKLRPDYASSIKTKKKLEFSHGEGQARSVVEQKKGTAMGETDLGECRERVL